MSRRIVTTSKSLSKTFTHGFVGGIGWALGISIGFSLLAFIVSKLFGALGALPVIGHFVANIISATQEALDTKSFPLTQ